VIGVRGVKKKNAKKDKKNRFDCGVSDRDWPSNLTLIWEHPQLGAKP
jgi:hypothetical protein